jgi:hypothetical protein
MARDYINKPLGPSELKLQLTISTDKTVADLKQAIADKSDVPADRQRLIYSGVSRLSRSHLAPLMRHL